ncbi:PfkB family carbohydrate kinase, partial [Salmonella enterica subsp. enterica serovar Kentucky]|nr:DeoR family transcriptional regulator [Salmonella enterica subsp. enterica serovar Kentucky]EBO8671179.1 DeoR family transcriptional regulator [Salmonella enterica subsp. enterica serovar Kentucky]EBO8947496.1 DeoR family transcriptional regulator [Salmonella enterica subsp. enterica serovar Kentucky]EBY9090125.1 DeoR family transcriptional regulator [Salmonella enterica subsp. enterica serovar Kentucky]ECA0088650.1 DeoR family transcriptional regulator [Salmonella enterica subsp. enterica s
MKFERHHRILKELSISGVVKVSNLAKSLKVTKETIRSDLNELAGQGYLTRCHGGAFITLDSLDNVAKNEIAYVLEKYESAQKIKKGLSAMKNNVCVIGSFNVDIISYLPRLPSTGESLLADKFIFSPGGKGCNQALAASYADSDVHFITKVGSDHFSDYAINFINSSKIHKSVIYQTKETQTGTATIMVNGDTGDNVIAIYPGANMTISPDEITIQKEAIVHSDIVLVQLETNYEALQQTIRLAQKNDIPVIINPAPYNDMVNTIIDNIDYITPNETEAGLLANMAVNDIESAKCAAKIIHQKGVKNTIITLGSKGSLAYDGTQFIYSPAFPAVVKNTAGAGDAFNGALASGLA